jgi:Transposase IS66 family
MLPGTPQRATHDYKRFGTSSRYAALDPDSGKGICFTSRPEQPAHQYHRDFARNLLKRWPALWTFAHTDGVEPTNNHAERGLRGAVIYRKLSLGSQSERGERTIERLLSASVTCRLRKQSLFAYLTQALAAHARGDPVPALT